MKVLYAANFHEIDVHPEFTPVILQDFSVLQDLSLIYPI